jgi:hypothetical protein
MVVLEEDRDEAIYRKKSISDLFFAPAGFDRRRAINTTPGAEATRPNGTKLVLGAT